ncbi:MAG TPA: hypothetical protein DCR14_02710 [Acidimicrobiaceae bacterium]|nr:hypothetical protein [Acidimicrobiaceae bacterium]
MNRRSFLVAALATPLMAQLLVACGEDSEEEGGITFPGGPNDVVLKVTSEGGFVPAGFAFVNTPSLLISGDGRAFEPGAITLEYPGPLLMPMFVRSISDDGITKVLQLAESAGLLATPPDYTVENLLIADAPTTVLTIQANGTTYVHRAEALGMDQPDGGASTPARENLAAFIATLVDLGAVAGAAEVGEPTLFAPERFRFQAMEVDPEGFDPAPTIEEWPADAGVALADATVCATAPASAVGALFGGADQLTFFTDGDDVVYQLFVAGMLPGDADC